MADTHEVTFVWPEIDANDVIVTGTFDKWSSSIHLIKTPGGFEGKVEIPWGDRVLYKFVVDGRWATAQSQPEETDEAGNMNNVYECRVGFQPSKPQPTTVGALPTEPPQEAVQSVHNEITEASSLAAPTTEQQTLPEQTAPVVHQVEETIVTAVRDVLPESTGPALGQAHATVIAPVVEAAQNLVANPAVVLDQVKEHVPPVVVETAQNAAETVKTAAAQAEVTVTPIVAHLHQEVREALTEKTMEPAKEQVNASIETVHDKRSDPLNPDKIPVATPTPTHDAFVITPQENPAIASTSQPAAEQESIERVSLNDATAAVNAVYPTAPGSTFAEPPPVAPAPAETTTGKIDPTAEASALTPPVFSPKYPSEAPSETMVVDQPPISNDSVREQPKYDLPPAPAPATELAAVTEAPVVGESAPATQTLVTAEPAVTSPAPDVTPEAKPALAEAKTLEQPKSSKAEPLPPTVEPAPPTTDTNQAEAPPITQTRATVDTSSVAPVPDTTSDSPPVQAQAHGSIQAAEPTPASVVPEKAINGHPSAAITPTKTPEESESSKSHAFPTTESKVATSTTSSPVPSSKFGSARKKRVSIFGKVKNLFTSDKEEKKEKK